MIFLYLRQVLRGLFNNKLDSSISIAGLAIGLAAAILILLFVQDERGYDIFWPDAERLYRFETRFDLEGRPPIETIFAMGPSKHALDRVFVNELEAVARINRRVPTIQVGADVFAERVSLVDPEILSIFPFEVMSGDLEATLADNRTIALSESLAQKYFGAEDALGKTITMTYSSTVDDYTVGAVIRDLPSNTHMKIDAMIRIDEAKFSVTPWLFENWGSVNNHVYLKLKAGVSPEAVSSRLVEFADNEMPSDDGKASNFVTFKIFPVLDIHLKATGFGEMKDRGDATLVTAFSAIAILIIAVAAINFVNLATARAGLRAREVALRKVVGARRSQLIAQHLSESFVIVGVAMLMALLVVEISIPAFNAMLGKSMASVAESGAGILLVLGAWLTLSFASGLYPAYLISSFRPGPLLHDGDHGGVAKGGRGRSILVAFQSAVTIGLIAATGVVAAQTDLLRSIDKGFDENGLIALRGTTRAGIADQRDALKAEIAQLPGIQSATYVSEAPTKPNEMTATVSRLGDDRELNFGFIHVDHDFFQVFDIPIIAGRGLDRTRALDRDPLTVETTPGERAIANIVINALAAQTLGFLTPEDAIGGQFQTDLSNDGSTVIPVVYTIIGVVPNLYLHSLKRELRPEIYGIGALHNNMIVRYAGEPELAVSRLEAAWQEIAPTVPFEYFFVDQSIADELAPEEAQLTLFAAFAALTVAIAAMGLYGLAAFVTERRTKEVGIRKVLGAGVGDIMRLLVWQFAKPVLVAMLVASPVIVYLMYDWLLRYPYRIDLGTIAGFGLVAGLIALAISLITVSTLSLRAASAHPIKALRHE